MSQRISQPSSRPAGHAGDQPPTIAERYSRPDHERGLAAVLLSHGASAWAIAAPIIDPLPRDAWSVQRVRLLIDVLRALAADGALPADPDAAPLAVADRAARMRPVLRSRDGWAERSDGTVLDHLGDLAGLADLSASTVQAGPATLRQIAHTIADAWHERAVALRIARSAADLAAIGGCPYRAAEAIAIEQRTHSQRSDHRQSLQAALADALSATAERATGVAHGASWGVDRLDLACPLAAGQIVCLAGMPGAGKTTLAVQASLATASAGGRSAVISLEMSSRDLGLRLLAWEAQISHADILARRCAPDALEHAQQAISDRIASGAVVIDSAPERSPTALLATIAALAHDGHQLIVLDYVQLMGRDHARQSEHEALASFMNGLVALTKRHQATILLLSQFRREGKAMLRDRSGAIVGQREPSLADLPGLPAAPVSAAGATPTPTPTPDEDLFA
jgi:RecA/RadA recombinase